MYDIVIVGGGPAGLTAAVYARRAGKTALVIEKGGFGGQIAFSPKVENIPGTQSISGAEFADQLVEQAMNLGADAEMETVVSIQRGEHAFIVNTEEGGAYEARSVILAVGVKHRMLGLDGEEELIGNGLSFCAVCDGAFYQGQDVAMIGGGNSALQEALLLAETSRKVTVVQNLPHFTGEKALADALLSRDNVEVLFSTLVTGYEQADGTLTGLRVRNQTTGEERTLAVSGVFAAVGIVPQSELVKDQIACTEDGRIITNEHMETNLKGVYAAGDVRTTPLRQVITACADGAVAATRALEYLTTL